MDKLSEFLISPLPHFDDPDFMSVHIEVDCSDPATTVTQALMESSKTAAMTPDTKVDEQYSVIYEDISYDKYTINGEMAGTVKAGSSSDLGDCCRLEPALLTKL